MTMNQSFKSNVVSLNWINPSDRCAIVPGYEKKNKRVPKLKELKKTKGNCFFTSNIHHCIIDFIYRATLQLNMKEHRILVSRGSVKRNNNSVLHYVDIYEHEWDVGTSIIIPRLLNYNKKISLFIKRKKHQVRLMEIIVLMGLLKIKIPEKRTTWYSQMAATIITHGWSYFESGKPLICKYKPA